CTAVSTAITATPTSATTSSGRPRSPSATCAAPTGGSAPTTGRRAAAWRAATTPTTSSGCAGSRCAERTSAVAGRGLRQQDGREVVLAVVGGDLRLQRGQRPAQGRQVRARPPRRALVDRLDHQAGVLGDRVGGEVAAGGAALAAHEGPLHAGDEG